MVASVAVNHEVLVRVQQGEPILLLGGTGVVQQAVNLPYAGSSPARAARTCHNSTPLSLRGWFLLGVSEMEEEPGGQHVYSCLDLLATSYCIECHEPVNTTAPNSVCEDCVKRFTEWTRRNKLTREH